MAEGLKRGDGDDALRAAYRGPMAADRPGHLTEGDWERLACAEMQDVERARAMEHVTTCAECTLLYRAVAMLRAEAPAFDPAAPRPEADGGARVPRIPAWAGLAAAGLAAMTVASWLALEARPWVLETPPRDAAVTRAPAANPAVVLLEPTRDVTSEPTRFRWSSVAGADSYRVRLFREDGLLLWTSDAVTAATVEWPAAVPRAPGRYFWEVQALREGRIVARSDLQAFARTP
jgi:hypothetical protein